MNKNEESGNHLWEKIFWFASGTLTGGLLLKFGNKIFKWRFSILIMFLSSLTLRAHHEFLIFIKYIWCKKYVRAEQQIIKSLSL